MSAAPKTQHRWAAAVEYDGTDYCGWQLQDSDPTIQREIQRALSSVANHPVKVVAAGRTDAGVHAWQQVIHFDSGADREPHAWLMGCNAQLPSDIAVRWAQPVPSDFDARRSATSRRYRYVIYNQRARPAVLSRRVAWVIQPLDAGRMNEAAQALVGEMDFSAFRDSQCQSLSPTRRVTRIDVSRYSEFVVLEIEANAFLHHMVRNIVGTLLPVGQGTQPAEWVREVLQSRDRRQAGVTTEARGLYFVGPSYPDEFKLPPAPEPSFPGSYRP